MALKKIWWIILLGLILRLIIASISYHPDVGIINFTSAVFLREFNPSPYDFVASLDPQDPRVEIFGKESPDDLPLQYLIRLPLEMIIRPLINTTTEDQFLLDVSNLLGDPRLMLHLLYIKFPLILFDLLLGVLLMQLVSYGLRQRTLLLWMINPITLWATAAIGQVDILPTLFIVLSAVLLSKNEQSSSTGKLYLAALSLGVGAALKSFPLILAPFLIFSAKGWGERLKLMLLITIPLIVSILPYLSSVIFRQQALFAPQIDKMLYAKIALSGGESLVITVAGLVFFYLIFICRAQRDRLGKFIAYSVSSLLFVLAFTHFHIQWFLWVTPFLIVYLARGLNLAQLISVVLIFAALLVMLFLFEASLQVRLLAPLIPQLDNARGLAETLSNQQVSFLRDLASSIFAGSVIFFIVSILKNPTPTNHD